MPSRGRNSKKFTIMGTLKIPMLDNIISLTKYINYSKFGIRKTIQIIVMERFDSLNANNILWL